MNFTAKLNTGAELLLENEGEETRVQLKTDDSSGHQSQNSSFKTGKWSENPQVFETKDGTFLQINAGQSPIFFDIAQNGIHQLNDSPDVEGAAPLSLEETDEVSTSPEMKPMAPMKPMKPLF